MTQSERTAPEPTTNTGTSSRTGIGRRAVFAGAGVAAVGVVAACSGTTTEDAGGQQQTDDLPEGAPGTELGPASDVPVGGGTIYSDEQIVVTQPSEGRFTGLSAICPHQGCSVGSVTDGVIVCPCHNSRFDLEGAVLEGPARQPLEPRPVTVADGAITLA